MESELHVDVACFVVASRCAKRCSVTYRMPFWHIHLLVMETVCEAVMVGVETDGS